MNFSDFRIGVVGLGYVGLNLAVQLSKHFSVVGCDLNETLVKQLKDGVDSTKEVDLEDLRNTSLVLTSRFDDLKNCNFFIVAVPTPATNDGAPDLSYVESATKSIAEILKKGDIVVYESTVYPGVTEDFCVPILESKGLAHLVDFNVGYSPERVNPGDRHHTLTNVVKIVSGDNSDSLETISWVYEKIVTAGVYRAKTIKVAEAAKALENTQRDVNIALINELSIFFNKVGIDTRDVIEAAGSKYNFMKFYPGLVGGHCIGVDPYYIISKAKKVGLNVHILENAREVNENYSIYVFREMLKKMLKQESCIGAARKMRVLVLGLTFKENVPDIRNSKVFDIIRLMDEFSIEYEVLDPQADAEMVLAHYGVSINPQVEDNSFDAVLLAVSHQEYVEAGWSLAKKYLRSDDGSVFDLKGILSVEGACSYNLWRP
ncbi:nucleotide sugar dehydrogenase [Hydromonas duriensis]|uniref:UDP-N-acetyl-D-galactosamine dehydrogenase n=1 Tax=Hydromonas duriensis TaxID=1527608 RepID=A0A4R6Y768_9BURK|nr:nucleotide sugar dehydrogenase [Hydromonas duriensis]TDR31147.1 UDP-N-acetyl-D-galactosamine dehydrogenase [Hydromonas duriensis]